MRVLYITHDGLTDHIGQSQVVPYLLGLAAKGFEIAIVSAEKPAKAAECRLLEERLRSAGIEWRHVPYRNRPPLFSTALVLMRLYRAASKILRGRKFNLIHCRGFLPTFVGLLQKRRRGVPLLFDFRDFWADRRRISGSYKFVYRFIKSREASMIRNADHIVTLTNKAKSILLQSYLAGQGRTAGERITVIPTCADVELFDTRRYTASDRRALRGTLGLGEDELILGYLGTVHPDYIPWEMFRVFRCLQSLDPAARFLFVSHTPRERIMEYARGHGVNEKDVVVVAADRADVPRYLALFDLSVVFVRADASTAGVWPTKLAELFACDVPVLANAGVGDLDTIIKPETNDSVLVHDFSDDGLRDAVQRLLRIVRLPARRGRIAAMQYSLEEGIRRYGTVYSRFAAEQ